MPKDAVPTWPEWMSAATLCKYIDVRDSTLNAWRAAGKGPAFKRVGRTVRYAKADVDQWVKGAKGGA